MNKDSRRFVADISSGDADPKATVAKVTFCESSASLKFGSITVHIPWTELVNWQAWLAQRVEGEA